MSTSANLSLGESGLEFNIGHDGSPANIIPEIVELTEEASKCKIDPEIHLIGLLLEDWLATGYGWAPGKTYANYKDEVDLEKGEISWIDEGKIITVNYLSKVIKLWNKKKISYPDSDELFSLVHAYEEKYFEEKKKK